MWVPHRIKGLVFDTLQSTNCPISFSHPTLRVNQFPIQITAGTCSRTIITIPTTVCHKMLGIRRSVINISKLRHNLIRHWRRNWNNDRKEFWNIDCCRLRGWDQTTSSVTKSEIFSLKSFIMRLRPRHGDSATKWPNILKNDSNCCYFPKNKLEQIICVNRNILCMAIIFPGPADTGGLGLGGEQLASNNSRLFI